MKHYRRRVTRRQVLAGVGTAGFLTAGVGYAGRALGDESLPYSRYTYAAPDDSDDGRLRVAWYETYNGDVQKAQNGSTETNGTAVLDPGTPPAYVEEAAGPVVTMSGLVPGDSGTLVVGLLAEEIPSGENGLDVWLRATLTADCENGVNEPEAKADGEDDPLGPTDCDDEPGLGTGELGSATEVAFWTDDGSVGSVGACDGSKGLGEDAFVSGTFREALLDTELADGRQVADCLSQGANRCLGLAWRIPEVAENHLQSDSLGFDLAFAAVPCGSTNPFAEDGGST